MEKIELKKIFNKHIFKDKSFIKMVCFTIVLLLVLVLGNTFGYVSADTTAYSHCLNVTDWQSSSFFVSNYYCDWLGGGINENDTIVFDYFCNTSDLLGTNPTMYESTKYYLLLGGTRTSYTTNLDLYMFDDESLYFISNPYSYSGGWTIYTKSDSYEVLTFQTYGDGTNLQSITRPSDVVISYPLTNTKTINGETYYYFTVGSSIEFPLLTNMNYYAFTNNVGYGDYVATMDSYLTDGSNASNIYQLNYMYGSAPELGGFSNLVGTTGASSLSVEGPENNAYVDYADWILNNYTGDIANNYRNMSVSFTSNLNDYIHEHYDDLEEQGDAYSIWLDYNVFIDFYYQTVIDYGNLGGGVTLGSEFASVSVDYNHDMVFTNNYHWSCNYVFSPSDNDASYISSGYLLPMDAFIEEYNQIYTLGLDGLFAYLSPSDGSGNLIGDNGTRVHTNLTLSQLMTLVKNNAIVWSANYDGLNQFKMTCTAKIIYDDGTTYVPSGTYIETFNLLDGTSTTDSNNMLTNYNPYTTNTSEDVTSSLPSTNTSGSSVATSSTGNVTQTVNVTNEGAKYIPSIISSLIPSSFGDTSTGLAQRFTTLVDSNNFITLMASTVPAIPSTVWTYLTEYLGISLYLLACAFVLRLILDLL